MTVSNHETADIYLAAYLLNQGATFVSCRRVGLRRNLFSFAADEKFHELLRLYWRRTPMTIIPADLFCGLQRLKSVSRLHPAAAREMTIAEASGRPAPAGPNAGNDPSHNPFPRLPC